MTDHVLTFLSAYQGTLAQAFTMPPALADAYDLHDCLRESKAKSTYLLKKKDDASFAVLKTATGDARAHLRAEYEILSGLHTPEFPQAISFFTDEQTDYFLRSYLAGASVSDYVERNGAFSEAEAVRLVLGLCGALAVLHSQTPPVIHRDIKPQNVIYTQQRTLALIDFDAARRYQPEQKMDTVYLGTQATAAPEQFGYQQTDQRSDIYSTGILLLFLCTGDYELEACASIRLRAVRHIIETCTRFDPQRRYRNIRALSRALKHALNAALPPAVVFWHGAALGLFVGVALSLALVRFGILPARTDAAKGESADATPLVAALAAEDQAIVFESPEIERAVREQLEFDETTPLYQADLDRVESLFLCGTSTGSSWLDVTNNVVYRSSPESGAISSLTDIPKLRNLTELALCDQRITDLSPLEGMRLNRLALNGNLISDLSSISTLVALRELYVGSNPIVKIDALEGLDLLQVVDLGSTNVSDLSPLSGNMAALYLNDTPILDYSPLLRMSALNTLFLNHPNQNCLDVVSQLSSLTWLEIGNGLTELEPVLRLENLTRLAIAPVQLTTLEGIETLEQLKGLRINAAPDIDLTPLTKLPNLAEMDIYFQELSDYSQIFQIPNLKTLYCSLAQQAEIDALNLPHSFEICAN